MNTAEAIARLGAFGLPGASSSPSALDDAGGVLDAAAAQRILPWLAAADADGLIIDLTDDWRRALRTRLIDATQTTLAAHAAAASVIERLEQVGVRDVRVLKGCATAHLDYERTADRFSTDVDLLIRPDDHALAMSAFPDQHVPTPRRPHWDERYGKATTIRSETGVEIDIHTSLVQGYFGLAIPTDELFASPDPFEIAGVAMRAVDGPNRLIHAALHLASSEQVGLHSARDVLQLVTVSEVDWAEAIHRTKQWRVDGLFAHGVAAAWSRFAVDSHPIVDWATGHPATGRQRIALRAVGGAHVRQFLTAPLALPVTRWPGYLGPMVFPSRAYLEEHGKTWSQRARLLARGLPGRRRVT